MRDDWEQIRLEVMHTILAAKFAPGTALAASLEATGTAELVEGNNWNDHFWGVCRNHGRNWLGKTLMRVRDENRAVAPGALPLQPAVSSNGSA